MIRLFKILLLLLLIFFPEKVVYSSSQSIIKGLVTDSLGKPMEGVTVLLPEINSGTYTDNKGLFSLTLPADGKEYTVVFSYVGFKTMKKVIRCDRELVTINVTLYAEVNPIKEIMVQAERSVTEPSLTYIPIKDINLLPSASGSFEMILKTMPGVSSYNELSSQYSVRGGSFDENLVYVNDIEIYRPFLIRSGQQEGLSFINPDLTSSVRFSSGGFSAAYGDKMSSVLDIRYRQPVSNAGSVNLGLLTSSLHYEGLSKNKKFSYLFGARYKSSTLMLKTLDAKGNYLPVFADIQSLLSYRTGNTSIMSFLGTFSSNTYKFIPESRVSKFGNEASAYQLFVLFNGTEKDKYEAWNFVLSWEFSGKNLFKHKILLSSFGTNEKESFDIRGSYSLSNLDKENGSENFSDSVMNIGIGSWLSHARNKLTANIQSLAYKGEKKWERNSISWGLRIRNEKFTDKIKEWSKVDSAGYVVPRNSEKLSLSTLIYSENNLTKSFYESFLQSVNTFSPGSVEVSVNAGIRGYYNSFSKEKLLSPRVSVILRSGENLSFHLSGGIYCQPPFFREMRYPDGTLNREIKSQQSFHTVFGIIYDFKAWDRPFRLSSELYNKSLSNIIPYRLDNVRIIYLAENIARGYSRGIDVRLNGEFVPDAESWISLSLMDSKLEIPSRNSGKFPSPSDQTLGLNLFFQDYLPGNPSYRAHLNIAFATGVPIISPYNDRFDQYHRLPAYRRVDLGMTKVIKSRYSLLPGNSFLRHFNEIVAGLEIFNLLDINNTISYLWLKTVNNLSGESRQFAIPNYLTGRSLNLKLSVTF
jgi:hypothetical protein